MTPPRKARRGKVRSLDFLSFSKYVTAKYAISTNFSSRPISYLLARRAWKPREVDPPAGGNVLVLSLFSKTILHCQAEYSTTPTWSSIAERPADPSSQSQEGKIRAEIFFPPIK
jgi:hypothetical protein